MKGTNERILDLVKKRLELGKKRYGHDNIISDGRNFELEAYEEILDAIVYIAAKLLEVNDRYSK